MKKKEWNEGLDHLDPDLIEKYLEQKDRLRQNKAKKKIWLRLSAVAACLAILVGAVIVVPMLMDDGIFPDPDFIPITNLQTPSSAPQYYGSSGTAKMPSGLIFEPHLTSISVVAKYVEALPDTYTFFEDWDQYEYRLLRMKTVKLIFGKEMTEEFYYLVPVDYMTDFSIFDKFVMRDMAQFTYEYSVMYNKTQGKAEQLNLVVFAYGKYDYHLMGESFMAFHSDGKFDRRLWESNETWVSATYGSHDIENIDQIEKKIQDTGYSSDNYRVYTMKDIRGEEANILEQIKSFDNGLFVPISFQERELYRVLDFHAVRYIDGFATNESKSIFRNEDNGNVRYSHSLTKAQFTEDDIKQLPDLSSAFSSVIDALNNGSVTPPNFSKDIEIKKTTNGVFGWYAKTESGVIGIIRVTWCFYSEKDNHYYDNFFYDDAYYIIEYGSDKVEPINRDALLEKLGEYETTYIYTGKYDEYGKVRNRDLPNF